MEEYSSFFDASFDGDVSVSTSLEDATGNGNLDGYSTIFDTWNANEDSNFMDEMDGVEVCRRVRQTSTLPIIMLTGRDNEMDGVLSGLHEDLLGYSLLFRC